MSEPLHAKPAIESRRPVALGLLLIVLTIAAYLPAFRAGFIWDDDRYITKNALLDNPAGLASIWFSIGATDQYYPLTYTTFWLEKQLWGLSPAPFHAANILLHALDALLLWRLLRRLGIPGAWFAAALFALHPINAESVAWVTERKNTLSLFFYLLAFHAYARFDRWSQPDSDSRRSFLAYALVAILFLAALLTKTVTATFPAAILLVLWWKRGHLRWRDIMPTLPLFLLGLASGLTTTLVESHHVGAASIDWQTSWPARFLIAGRALWFYAGKLLWPYPLTFTYPRWQIDPARLVQYLDAVFAIGLVAAAASLRRQIGRGPLAALLFYGGSLLPMLGFVDIYSMRFSYVADHFAYLPCIGLIVLIAASAAHAANGLLQAGKLPPLLPRFACVVLLGVCAILTWNQSGIYANERTLWADTVRKNPAAWMAHNNLGLLLQQGGDLDSALMHYRKAVELQPDFFQAHYNTAVALQKKGLLLDAGKSYEAALKIRPDLADAHFNYGRLLVTCQNYPAAIAHFEEVLRISPEDYEARLQLGGALADSGKRDEGIREIKRALKHMQDRPSAYARLAQVYLDKNDLVTADAYFRAAIRRKADYPYAHYGLATCLDRSGRFAEAVEEYKETLRLDPSRKGISQRIETLMGLIAASQPAPARE